MPSDSVARIAWLEQPWRLCACMPSGRRVRPLFRPSALRLRSSRARHSVASSEMPPKGVRAAAYILKHAGVREVARPCAKGVVQPLPPVLVPAVRRMDFCRLVSIPPQLDTDRRKAASSASNWSRYVVRLIRHSGVPILPKVCTRDRSHRRSSMVATPWSKGREPRPPLSVFR